MGKINQGILGGFSGKVGNVIGGNWKGIDYMRVKAANVSNPRTEGQVDQRTKFTTVLEFLQPMKDFLKVGFKDYANKMTQFNSAMSYNLKNAIEGTFPNYVVDYQSALVSRGGLAAALNPSAGMGGGMSEVAFTWDNNSGDGNASEADTSMLLVYNQAKKEAIYVLQGSTRAIGSFDVSVPTNYGGDELQCFVSFISETGEVSNSKFAGTVVL